jgi:hypothetical protein
MKNSPGLRKISINAAATEAGFLKMLIKDILHGREVLKEPGLTVFVSPDGMVFEFYSTGANVPEYLFSHSDTVNTFQVDDLKSALADLQDHGACLLGEVVYMSRSSCFCYISLSDGCVIGLLQYNGDS